MHFLLSKTFCRSHIRELMPLIDGRILTATNALILCLFRLGNSLQLQTCITRKWYNFSLHSLSFASIRSTQRGGKWNEMTKTGTWTGKGRISSYEAVNLMLTASHTHTSIIPNVERWVNQRTSAHAQTLLIPSVIVYQLILSLGHFHLQHSSPIRIFALFLLSHRYQSEKWTLFFMSSRIQCWKWIDIYICMLKCSGYHRFIYGLRTILFDVDSFMVRASERVLPCATCRYFSVLASDMTLAISMNKCVVRTPEWFQYFYSLSLPSFMHAYEIHGT